MSRIYLDNAATSWPKPETVYDAVNHTMRELGAPVGRSAYHDATRAARLVAEAREALARLLVVTEPHRIVFASNGTDALNLAIHGIVRPGDHVVTSHAEHNSVLRPLRRLESVGGVQVTRVACDAQGVVDVEAMIDAIGPKTRLVVLTHASNVTGAVQPVARVASAVRNHGGLLLVDAAQTLGHLPVSVEALGADLLAAPGHKGLLGPLGTGVLYVGPRAEPFMQTVREGGTGTDSQEDQHPETLPEKFEAGNLNVPGIAGLAAGVRFLAEQGVQALQQQQESLAEHLRDGLGSIPGVTLYGPSGDAPRVPLISIAVQGYDVQEVAMLLDSGYQIQVRAGLHCAPLVHRAMGTESTGGTVRFSLGPFTTRQDIDAALGAIHEIAASDARSPAF